ncbi:hypothetical protein RT97_27110 [Variovorax paradoxus]|uniref:Uncharacterized protein n=2 Tax=Variovorax paradoxus TaxID=34073 RepID=A0A0D0LTP9_VARPD|nr:hypothetical protein RT97_27110 [Variovorax paradoxus]
MEHHQDKIVCIGWGSLIWDPRTLPCVGGWNRDGPMLPVEFARESAGRKITLVICENVPEVQSLWTLLAADNVATARQQLGLREFEAAKPKWIEANIGYWDRSGGIYQGEGAPAIAAWAQERGLAGVVWTGLSCGFKISPGVMPRAEEIVAHLNELDGAERIAAEEYVRRAPSQIDTEYRKLIASELDWT